MALDAAARDRLLRALSRLRDEVLHTQLCSADDVPSLYRAQGAARLLSVITRVGDVKTPQHKA